MESWVSMDYIKKIGNEWIKDNLFKFKKGDGAAYFFLYLVVPTIITYVSLKVAGEPLAITYSYLSILISALNCFYDAANRWNRESKSIINTKLFIMYLFLAVISIYCFYIVIGNVLRWSDIVYFDWIFYAYYAIIAVAVIDIAACFGRDMALVACVRGE